MSTRCDIKVIYEDGVVFLYHHHDGYPEYVGKFLYNKFNEKIKSCRFYSPSSVVNELIKNTEDDEYEWTTELHGDIEYLYEIDLNKKEIRCFEVKWGSGERYVDYENPIDLSLIK